MRSFLIIALVLVAGAASLLFWGAGYADRVAAYSSQIFIHGTPVCVTQRGDRIEAAVGTCDANPRDPRGGSGGYHGTRPGPVNPHMGLPPGHPPIDDMDPSPGFEERGRTGTLI
jgi:hypothetical protein